MSHFLILGRAGSGKTAVAHELRRRGLAAFDADEVKNLSNWIELSSGKHVSVDPAAVIDYTKVDWLWDEDILVKLLTPQTEGDLFLCGGAGNDLALGQKYFDKIFFLAVTPEIQHARLLARTNNNYGKNPRMIPKIIAQQAQLRSQAIATGALEIDANQPIAKVVDAILELLR